MERLTKQTKPVTEVVYVGRYAQLRHICGDTASTMRVSAVRDVLKRLAEYEDTGLTPEQITNPKENPPTKPCMYCTPEALKRGQYVAVKNIIGRWYAEKEIKYCWNCGRKIEED